MTIPSSRNGKKNDTVWHQQSNPALFIWHLQYDNRRDGELCWEEIVVRATTREDAIEVSGMDIYDPEHIYSNIIGIVPAGDEEKVVICYGIHDHEFSWEFLKKEIRYEPSNRRSDLPADDLFVDEPTEDGDEESTDDLEPDDL